MSITLLAIHCLASTACIAKVDATSASDGALSPSLYTSNVVYSVSTSRAFFIGTPTSVCPSCSCVLNGMFDSSHFISMILRPCFKFKAVLEFKMPADALARIHAPPLIRTQFSSLENQVPNDQIKLKLGSLPLRLSCSTMRFVSTTAFFT